MARILVVDDEPHILRLVAFSLEKGGHDVLQAPDAAEGIRIATDEGPDLVLMDVMMPGMTGLEALERLKDAEATRQVPVVMLSAKSQAYEQEEGLRRGALRYICKPFTPKDLVEAVSEILAEEQKGAPTDGT